MSGVDFRIPLAEVKKAAAMHDAGWSLRALGRMNYRDWGYSSPQTAYSALRRALQTLDLPIRDQQTATVQASLIHGDSTRFALRKGNRGHARHLARRRLQRKQAA